MGEFMKYIFDGNELIDKLKKLSGLNTIRELAREFDDLIPSEESVSDPVKNWESKIGRWKHGIYPSTKDLIALSMLYKCSVDYLLGLDDNEPLSNNPQYDFLVSVNELADNGDVSFAVYRNTEEIPADPDSPFSETKKIRVFRPAIVIRDNSLCYFLDRLQEIRHVNGVVREKALGELLHKIRYKNSKNTDTPSFYQWMEEFQKRFN